jgi:hypothetical protein
MWRSPARDSGASVSEHGSVTSARGKSQDGWRAGIRLLRLRSGQALAHRTRKDGHPALRMSTALLRLALCDGGELEQDLLPLPAILDPDAGKPALCPKGFARALPLKIGATGHYSHVSVDLDREFIHINGVVDGLDRLQASQELRFCASSPAGEMRAESGAVILSRKSRSR